MTDGREEIRELARRFSREDFFELLKGAGKRVRGGLAQCPLEMCRDKGPEHLDGRVHQGRHVPWVYSCHSCRDGVHDYVDLYRIVKGVDLATALAELRGFTPAPSKPHLHVVRAPVLQTSAEKLTPAAVEKAWRQLAEHDDAGETYLEGRRLQEAVTLGYARFATEELEQRELMLKAQNGFRVAVQMKDLAGRALGVQFRSVLQTDDKLRSLKGSHTKGVYFGRPGEVLGARCVVVAEGMADTLAALLWVKGEPDTAVIGAPGAGNVGPIADALEDAGVDVAGQLWVLLAQHDRNRKHGNVSLSAFMTLKARLQAKGADVVFENEPPGDEKDWARAWQLQQLGEWPPTQVRRYLGGSSAAGETDFARAPGAAIPHAEEAVEPEHLGQDLTSLAYLLSAEATRRAICGAGEWRLNEMTDEVEYASAALSDDDYAQLRLNIEGFRGTMNNKRLRFAKEDVRAVVRTLGRKKQYSPVREYLERLGPADGGDWWRRCGVEAMGLNEQEHGLELTYLRLWAISAVARAYEPGCQVDTVLVLQGDEGQHKSRFFQELVPERRLFVRFMGDLSNEWKAVEAMRRGWLVELDEMASLLRARDYAEVLAFVARDVDTYAPKHVREAVAVPRRFVLGGSVNPEQFLADETGDRRFWVVRVRSVISREWLRENRDRLWAQALAEYRAKVQWHLPRELEGLRRAANKEHKVQHPWVELVAEYFHDKPLIDFVTMQELYGKALFVEPPMQNGGTHRVLAEVLRSLGWWRGVQGPEHARQRGWRRQVGRGR